MNPFTIISDATLSALMAIVRKAFPNATVGEDNDGQLVIYTDTMVK